MIDKNKLSSRFKKFTSQPQSVAVFEETKTKVSKEEKEDITFPDLQSKFKSELFEKIEKVPVWFEYTKERQNELIKNFVETKINEENIEISDIDKDILIDELCGTVSIFGILQPLCDNANVSAIYVNGTKNVYIEIGNKVLNTEIKLTAQQFKFIVNSLFSKNTDKGYVKTVKNDNFVITKAGSDNLSIRRIYDCSEKVLCEKISDKIFKLLVSVVENKKNVVIAGGINSGKTTVLDGLLKFAINGKRCFLFANEISTDFDGLANFSADINSEDYKKTAAFVLKSSPEYVVSDLNFVDIGFLSIKGAIFTMRANSVNDVLQTVIGHYMKTGLSEKFAKIKTLENIDYILMLNNGAEMFEISHAKTSAESVKSIAKV